MARIYIGEEPHIVNARRFIWARDAYPSIDLHCACVECGQRAFLNDVKGARGVGIESVNAEVTSRKGNKRRSGPGFSHYGGNAGKACPLYFADDPRFKAVRKHNEFDALERERNLAVLDKYRMREALSDIETDLMRKLTGEKEISAATRKALDKWEKRVLSMVGIAEYPWALPYIVALLVGPQKKGH